MARLIESVFGHEEHIDSLIHLKLNNRWPHAFLFVGPSAIGKKKLALAFAQMLICEQSDTACGVCGPCLRVAKLQSENLTIIEPDTSLVKPVIKVDAIRGLLDALSLASLGGKRVVLIDEAFTMNPQAANTLLKTLEEPFENVYFFLIGQSVQQFLPTIRSRSQVVRFSSLSVANLKRIKPGLPEWAYDSARGQVDRLVQMTSNDGLEKRAEAFTFLQQFIEDADFLKSANWRQQVKDRSWSNMTIGAWLQVICGALAFKAQAKGLTHLVSDIQTEQIKKLAPVTAEKLLKLSEYLLQAERDIAGNLDPVLVFEKMWVEYARVG
ncbi:MAG: DNA polymerase III subunit delta' [Bdellovibrio sp.]|nr:DNA polymerase III subunit delta' [Bdellovibrio sp.]